MVYEYTSYIFPTKNTQIKSRYIQGRGKSDSPRSVAFSH